MEIRKKSKKQKPDEIAENNPTQRENCALGWGGNTQIGKKLKIDPHNF